MVSEAAADNATNTDATEVEATVTRKAEAGTVPTLVQAATAATARRLDNKMLAEAAADNAMPADT